MADARNLKRRVKRLTTCEKPTVREVGQVELAGAGVLDVAPGRSGATRLRFQDCRAEGVAATEGGQSNCPRRPGSAAVDLGQT